MRNIDKTNNPSSALGAIKAAEASLKLARELLSSSIKAGSGSEKKDLSGLSFVEGAFDGAFMVDASGKKYKVNENYATKSMRVYGDKLRAYDDNGKYWFKQIDKVKREKLPGMLTKKANVWHVVTADGSYKVSPEAVQFLNLDVNDDVEVYLPSSNKRVPFATLDFVEKVRKGENVKEQTKTEKAPEKKEKEEKKEKPKLVKKPISVKAKPRVEKEVKEKVVLEEDDLR